MSSGFGSDTGGAIGALLRLNIGGGSLLPDLLERAGNVEMLRAETTATGGGGCGSSTGEPTADAGRKKPARGSSAATGTGRVGAGTARTGTSDGDAKTTGGRTADTACGTCTGAGGAGAWLSASGSSSTRSTSPSSSSAADRKPLTLPNKLEGAVEAASVSNPGSASSSP